MKCNHAAGYVTLQCKCGLRYQRCRTCETDMRCCTSCSREPKNQRYTTQAILQKRREYIRKYNQAHREYQRNYSRKRRSDARAQRSDQS